MTLEQTYTPTDSKTPESMLTGLMRRIYQRDKILILISILAGTAAFGASWAASSAATASVPSPLGNAGIGVIVSVSVYFVVFFLLTFIRNILRRTDVGRQNVLGSVGHHFLDCCKTVGLKEIFEQGLRFSIHVGLMTLAFSPSIASPVAQLIAGGFGHLTIPFFANIAVILKARRLQKITLRDAA